MANISNNPAADGLKVSTAGTAQTGLHDDAGAAIFKANGAEKGSSFFVPVGGVNDDNVRAFRTDRLGGQALALNNLILTEPFEGSNISTNRFVVSATTFTQAQTTAAGLNLNSGASAASAAAVLFRSLQYFVKQQRTPLQAKFRLRPALAANSVAEWGFGLPANQTTEATDGCYFQITTGGVLQGVVATGGANLTVALSGVNVGTGNTSYYTFDVILDDDEARFVVQDTATGAIIDEDRIQLPLGQVRLWQNSRLPLFARLHNTALAASAPVFIITSADIVALDLSMNRPWQDTAALNGYSSGIQPISFAQAETWANSAAPASSTLSNTAAGATTLGGLFQFAAVAGAATDYALFGFTVPAPYTLVVKGIDIETWNTGAAVATTPTLLVWGCGYNQSAVSLATAGIYRKPLGAQSFAVAAAIGAKAERISADFSHAPLVTNAGRFFTIVLRMPVATATASQVIQGMVTIKGHYE
jgi:hypothetical protein